MKSTEISWPKLLSIIKIFMCTAVIYLSNSFNQFSCHTTLHRFEKSCVEAREDENSLDRGRRLQHQTRSQVDDTVAVGVVKEAFRWPFPKSSFVLIRMSSEHFFQFHVGDTYIIVRFYLQNLPNMKPSEKLPAMWL